MALPFLGSHVAVGRQIRRSIIVCDDEASRWRVGKFASIVSQGALTTRPTQQTSAGITIALDGKSGKIRPRRAALRYSGCDMLNREMPLSCNAQAISDV